MTAKRTKGVVEIPFTDEWMDAPLPVYQDGTVGIDPGRNLEEEAVGAGERLAELQAAWEKKLRAKVAQA